MRKACGAGAAVCALVLASCGRSPEKAAAVSEPSVQSSARAGRVVLPPGSPKRGRIRVVPVRTAQLPCEEVSAPGKIEVNPNRISRVVMPVAGRVQRVHVRLGDTVAEGQTLLTIDSPEASAAITSYRQGQSQQRQARSALAKAETDLARVRDLHEHLATALKEVLQAQNELTQCQAALEQAQAASDAALHRLGILGLKPAQATQDVLVRSPISGKVLEIAVVTGEYRTDTNTSLMTIADLGTVWITADVPEDSIRLIQNNEAVQVELAAYPGEILRGRVMRIADTVDPQTRSIKVQSELDNRSGRFRPEMFGRILHAHGSCTRRVVPVGAILHGDTGAYVFVERGDAEYEQAEVRPGETWDGHVALLSGPEVGERVVVEGAILLKSQ